MTVRCTISAQNLSLVDDVRASPIKVLVVDTQVYSNTGGQACTSGFIGQVSDMAQFGKVNKGQGGSAQGDRPDRHGAPHHRVQSTIAHANHMIEGFIQG